MILSNFVDVNSDHRNFLTSSTLYRRVEGLPANYMNNNYKCVSQGKCLRYGTRIHASYDVRYVLPCSESHSYLPSCCNDVVSVSVMSC